MSKSNDGADSDDLAETKRIMERLVKTPPKPHKGKGEEKTAGEKTRSKKPVAKSGHK